MTAQINDTFRYEGDEYSLAGIDQGSLFDPSIVGLKPTMASTACYRGYRAVYALSDSHVVLDALDVRLVGNRESSKGGEGPAINGVRPKGRQTRHDMFNNHYQGLAYRLDYTGGLLIAKGFIRELYVHMGFHPAWKYEDVVELVFDRGLLTDEYNRSEEMTEVRRMIMKSREDRERHRPPDDEEIQAFIDDAFDRTYSL
jgi:hypothetical protein